MAGINVPKNNQISTLEAATNPTTDKPYNSNTFRIRGVPLAWELRELQNFLQNSFSDTQLRVRSLAVEINKHSQTATATFTKFSHQPQNGEEWNIPILSNDPIEDDSLKLDDGFAGITTLYSPPLDKHNIE
jgi:hypothetical protein